MPCEDSEKVAIYKPQRGLSPGTELIATLILDFPASRNELSTNKSPWPDGITDKFPEALRVNAYPSETIPKSCRGKNTPKIILRPLSPNQKQTSHQKENYRPVSLINIRHKNPQQNTSNSNPRIH